MANVSEKQAYEWVKTGHWTFSQFLEWVIEQRSKVVERIMNSRDSLYED